MTDKLLRYIAGLGPVEFAGLARVLKVKLTSDDVEGGRAIPREFVDVLSDVLAAFEKCNRKRKREILDVVKKASKHPIKSQKATEAFTSFNNVEGGRPLSAGQEEDHLPNEGPARELQRS